MNSTGLPVAVAAPAAILAPSSAQRFDTSILAGQIAESSQAMYKRDFRAYLTFAGSFERAMQPSTLARWRSHLANETEYSPRTINRMLAATKRLMREAAMQGYVSHEIAEQFSQVPGVKVKALKERQRANNRIMIRPEDMRAICSAPDVSTLAGKMHRALLATLASSGMRISEAVTLTLGQIEYGVDDRGQFGYTVKVLGKNETEPSERPLSTEAYNLICEWLEARSAAGVDCEHIFTGTGGRGARRPLSTPIAPQSAWEMVKRYAEAVGVSHVKPHDFRRFVGTRLVKERGIRAAQQALGHKSIETTARNYDLSSLERGMTENLY